MASKSNEEVSANPNQEVPPSPSPGDAEKRASRGPAPAKRTIEGVRWLGVCTGLYLTAFLYGLDTTIAADIQASILGSLGEIAKLPWVGVGFPMGSVATIVVFGKLYSIFDTKYVYLTSIVLFEIGSAICGAAPSMNVMIVGRVVAGVGGSGEYLGCLNYVASLASPSETPLYTALIIVFWGIGTICGPAIGGGFADSSATWRWSFYINLVLAAVTAPIFLIWFPPLQPQPQTKLPVKLRKLDWAGAILNILVFALFTTVLTLAGAVLPWQAAGVVVLWVLFGISLIGFIIQQHFCLLTTQEHRIFPVHLLENRTVLATGFGTAASATAAFITIYYIPLLFQFTRQDSAIEAAVRILPFVVPDIIFILLVGATFPVHGWYAPFYLVGGALIVIGGSLMYSLMSPTLSAGAVYGFEIVLAIGAGLTSQLGYTVSPLKVPPHDIPGVICIMNICQVGSVALCLAIAGSIFNNVGFAELDHVLQDLGHSDQDIRAALAGTESTLLAKSSPVVRQLAIKAIVDTISKIYALVFSAGALCIVSSFLMRWERCVIPKPNQEIDHPTDRRSENKSQAAGAVSQE